MLKTESCHDDNFVVLVVRQVVVMTTCGAANDDKVVITAAQWKNVVMNSPDLKKLKLKHLIKCGWSSATSDNVINARALWVIFIDFASVLSSITVMCKAITPVLFHANVYYNEDYRSTIKYRAKSFSILTDIWRNDDVIITQKRCRFDVIRTLLFCYYTICPLGLYFTSYLRPGQCTSDPPSRQINFWSNNHATDNPHWQRYCHCAKLPIRSPVSTDEQPMCTYTGHTEGRDVFILRSAMLNIATDHIRACMTSRLTIGRPLWLHVVVKYLSVGED